jgi:hypothetical protein
MPTGRGDPGFSVAPPETISLRRVLQLIAATLLPAILLSPAAAAGSTELRLPAVDRARLLAEDEASRGKGTSHRIGLPLSVDLSPADSGEWLDVDGGRLWRLQLTSEGARWMVLGFDRFRLRPGAELSVADSDGSRRLGPYTAADVREHGQLWTPPLAGDSVTVELFLPATLSGDEPGLHLGTVSHGYRFWGAAGEEISPGDEDSPEVSLGSGACNIDINCPLGNDWQDQKRAVVRLLVGGSALCSGSLVNNTANDCAPYVLTAQHCVETGSEAAATTIQLNYERSGCESGGLLGGQTLSGATLRATYGSADMSLLRMGSSLPAGHDAYFSGWSRSPLPAARSWTIHHPDCDFKKISFNDDSLINGIHWGAEHWRVNDWEQGTTESCSSGAPLFDPDGRIVGQLHGGNSSCDNPGWDEYGKFASSWNGGGSPGSQLSFWLDPLGTGALTLDGIDNSVCVGQSPELVYTSHIESESLANGNGVLDPGEGRLLEIDLINQGTQDAGGVFGTLSSSTPLVSVSIPEAGWPGIPIDQERSSLLPHFEIQLDPAFPCGDPVDLQLRTQADESAAPWLASLRLNTGSPQVTLHMNDDLEGSTAGWSTQALIGTQLWTLSTADSSSPTHSWFVADTTARRETTLSMPRFFGLPANAVLRFRHRINTEATHDGGVLEYSTDGGQLWIDAGGLIVIGGYNSLIDDEGSAPLAGRDAWSGDLGGFREVAVDLGSLAGSDLDVRWRFGSNIFGSDEGWYVDDVVIDTTTYDCLPQATAPGEASADRGAPFLIDKIPGGYRLDWSAPLADGVASGYRLYRVDPRGPVVSPLCEADLGNGTTAELTTLTGDSGFLVVGVNSIDEGPYGNDSDNTPRSPAQGGAVCP